nr:uncharacterized protein LOC128702806 [Cherax quadricarinatus]
MQGRWCHPCIGKKIYDTAVKVISVRCSHTAVKVGSVGGSYTAVKVGGVGGSYTAVKVGSVGGSYRAVKVGGVGGSYTAVKVGSIGGSYTAVKVGSVGGSYTAVKVGSVGGSYTAVKVGSVGGSHTAVKVGSVGGSYTAVKVGSVGGSHTAVKVGSVGGSYTAVKVGGVGGSYTAVKVGSVGGSHTAVKVGSVGGSYTAVKVGGVEGSYTAVKVDSVGGSHTAVKVGSVGGSYTTVRVDTVKCSHTAVRLDMSSAPHSSEVDTVSALTQHILKDVKRLRNIEVDTFKNMSHLRTIYISHAPRLHQLPTNLFHVFLPSLKVLRIVHTGLVELPSLSKLSTRSIIHMVDLENNRIRRVRSRFINITAEQLLLDNNVIHTVEERAFQGSQIGKLSMKGNPGLTDLHPLAFQGLRSLVSLDLSETGIHHLPTVGLEEVENLQLEGTYNLKVFPSVYSFKSIVKAQLTYHYHCCAFKFPRLHDPAEHKKHEESVRRMEKEHCSEVTLPAALATASLVGLGRRRRKVSSWATQRDNDTPHGHKRDNFVSVGQGMLHTTLNVNSDLHAIYYNSLPRSYLRQDHSTSSQTSTATEQQDKSNQDPLTSNGTNQSKLVLGEQTVMITKLKEPEVKPLSQARRHIKGSGPHSKPNFFQYGLKEMISVVDTAGSDTSSGAGQPNHRKTNHITMTPRTFSGNLEGTNSRFVRYRKRRFASTESPSIELKKSPVVENTEYGFDADNAVGFSDMGRGVTNDFGFTGHYSFNINDGIGGQEPDSESGSMDGFRVLGGRERLEESDSLACVNGICPNTPGYSHDRTIYSFNSPHPFDANSHSDSEGSFDPHLAFDPHPSFESHPPYDHHSLYDHHASSEHHPPYDHRSPYSHRPPYDLKHPSETLGRFHTDNGFEPLAETPAVIMAGEHESFHPKVTIR